MERLPPGRHGLSPSLVEENQRQRLALAAAESLAARGYGAITTTEVVKLAGVSTASFYKRFDDLWDCLRAAYEAGAKRLCERIESSCVSNGGSTQRAPAAVEGALSLLASEPSLAYLLSTEPPAQIGGLRAARARFIARLVALLRGTEEHKGGEEREERLVGGALALISGQIRSNGAERLEELAPTLIEILLGPQGEDPQTSPERDSNS